MCGFPLAALAACMTEKFASVAKRVLGSALATLLPLPIPADTAAHTHSSLGAGRGSDKLVLAGGCWQPCGRFGWAEADAYTVVQWEIHTELMAAGSALLFTCGGSAAGVLGLQPST